MQAYLGDNGSVYPGIATPEDYSLAYQLMVYELVAVCIFLRVYLMRSHNPGPSNLTMSRTGAGLEAGLDARKAGKINFGYWAFIAVVLVLVATVPSSLTTVSFVLPRYDYGLEQTQLQSLTAYLVLVAKNLAFVMALVSLNSKRKTGITVALSILVTLLSGCIYVGLNRSDFLLSMISSVLLYAVVVRRHVRVIVTLMAIAGISLVIIVSASRSTWVDPTATALQNLAFTLQAYTGGVYDVAMSVVAAHQFPDYATIQTLVIDVVRPVFGLNMILKQYDLIYSSIPFNWVIYGTDHRAQIIPMVGEGYFTLGPALAPILSVAFTWLAVKLSRILSTTSRPEVFFFVTITVLRLGFMMGQSATIQMNDLSFNLFVPLLVIWVNGLVSGTGRMGRDAK
ncbi:MAG: hypothetical protein FWF36_03350 [Propionibacteriaceae bacterium]|nr:hypothetical protein [Propionibacteriaceae bacterium]